MPLRDPGIAPARSLTRWPWVVVLGLFVVLAVVDIVRRQQTAAPPPPQPTASAPAGEVVALGRLQPRGGVIEVAAPTTTPTPRVLALLVEENARIEPGQPLVTLDTCPQLAAAEGSAKRAVEVAEAALQQARRDVKSGRSESDASVEKARAAAQQAERDRARAAQLFAKQAITKAELEAAEANASQTAAEVQRGRAAAGRYADPADIRVAEAKLAAARADLVRTTTELDACTVRAPMAATVLSIATEPGERAATGTLLRIADLAHMEAELEVFQDDVGRVEIGQTVQLSSGVLGGEPLRGTVYWIGIEVGRQSLTSNDPAASNDARVVRVRVDLDEASTPRAGRFVGLEVIAHIAARTLEGHP